MVKEMEVEVTTRSEYLEGNDWVPKGIHWTCQLVESAASLGIKGCPLGRANTREGALRDLVRRIAGESKIVILPWEDAGEALTEACEKNGHFPLEEDYPMNEDWGVC
jgi:hypothetical protein